VQVGNEQYFFVAHNFPHSHTGEKAADRLFASAAFQRVPVQFLATVYKTLGALFEARGNVEHCGMTCFFALTTSATMV
jgi:hypothetical protein